MKKVTITLFLFVLLPTILLAQTITDKSGYRVSLNYYDKISVEIDNRVRFIGDGYDEVIITKRAIIIDRERKFTDKAYEFAQKPEFWIAFMKHHGFELVDEEYNQSKPQSKVEKFMTKAKDMTLLTFKKQ